MNRFESAGVVVLAARDGLVALAFRTMRTKRELEQRLGEQIAWLRASAGSFDAGVTSEAKRIAVVIRTLVHGTAVSRGLLGQLKVRDEIRWLSAVAPTDAGFAEPSWMDGALEAEYRHISGMPAFECSLQEWWRGRMLQFDRTPIDRSWFVLSTANFDGGAHVDPVLPAAYRSITRDGGLKTARINGAGDP